MYSFPIKDSNLKFIKFINFFKFSLYLFSHKMFNIINNFLLLIIQNHMKIHFHHWFVSKLSMSVIFSTRSSRERSIRKWIFYLSSIYFSTFWNFMFLNSFEFAISTTAIDFSPHDVYKVLHRIESWCFFLVLTQLKSLFDFISIIIIIMEMKEWEMVFAYSYFILEEFIYILI